MPDLPALPDQHKDGRSFVPALNTEDYDRGPIYWHFPHDSNHGFQSSNGAIRFGRYKLLEYYENGMVQVLAAGIDRDSRRASTRDSDHKPWNERRGQLNAYLRLRWTTLQSLRSDLRQIDGGST